MRASFEQSPMCLRDENVNHLFPNCRVAEEVWNAIILWFNISWVLASDSSAHFSLWQFWCGKDRWNALWSLSFVVAIWSLWKQRNKQCFDNKPKLTKEGINQLDWVISSALVSKSFKGVLAGVLNPPLVVLLLLFFFLFSGIGESTFLRTSWASIGCVILLAFLRCKV